MSVFITEEYDVMVHREG